MKLITAIIKPFKLDDVRNALSEIGVQVLLSPRLKVSVDKRATLNCIEVRNM